MTRSTKRLIQETMEEHAWDREEAIEFLEWHQKIYPVVSDRAANLAPKTAAKEHREIAILMKEISEWAKPFFDRNGLQSPQSQLAEPLMQKILVNYHLTGDRRYPTQTAAQLRQAFEQIQSQLLSMAPTHETNQTFG